MARLLGPDVDAEGFADAWRERVRAVDGPGGRGEQPWAVLDELHASRSTSCSPSSGRARSTSRPGRLGAGLAPAGPVPDSVAGLTRLKTRYVIATLSNGNVSLLVNMARHGGLPWDTVLSAELFGHYKPPRVYDGAARLLGLPPQRC